MDNAAVTIPSTTKPTHARHWLIVFAVTLSVITYIDRVCISQAAPDIRRDLKLDSEQMGYIFGAFGIAYSIFEIPGGWLGDKIGPRKVLMRVVCMWSFFTAATGWAWNFISLLATRFLFGAGEAGCFPNLAKAFTNWLPRSERSRAVGIMWLSARWGGAITPLLVVAVFSFTSWRRAFELFGALGVIWAIWFFFWFRDNPRDHKSVNAAELELMNDREVSGGHVQVPWSLLAKSRTIWLLWLQYFCFGYGWYFYITWLPTYLKDARGVQIKNNPLLAAITELLSGHFAAETVQTVQAAMLSGIPLLFGGVGCILSGWLAGLLVRRGFAIAPCRRSICYVAFFGASVLSFAAPYIPDPVWAMIIMGMASFFLDLAITIGWSACMDVGGKYAGTVSGGMNMAGNLGGAIGPVVVGMILKYSNQNWMIPFWISAVVYAIGGLSWFWIDPVTRIDQDTDGQSHGFKVVTSDSEA